MSTMMKNELTKEEIKKILLKRYEKTHGGVGDRNLLVSKGESCIFLELEGSPPKGYGIWTEENRRLFLYEAHGKLFKEYHLQNGVVDL